MRLVMPLLSADGHLRASRLSRRDRFEKNWGISTWELVVSPGPNGGSRFLTRGRYDYASDWANRVLRSASIIAPGHG